MCDFIGGSNSPVHFLGFSRQRANFAVLGVYAYFGRCCLLSALGCFLPVRGWRSFSFNFLHYIGKKSLYPSHPVGVGLSGVG